MHSSSEVYLAALLDTREEQAERGEALQQRQNQVAEIEQPR